MGTDKLLSAVSLCRKAGRLVTGFDAVKESTAKGEACLVFCAGDLSANTRKRVDRFCEQFGTQAKTALHTQDALAQVCTKRSGVFAVTDPGLAKLVKSQLPAEENET